MEPAATGGDLWRLLVHVSSGKGCGVVSTAQVSFVCLLLGLQSWLHWRHSSKQLLRALP